MSELFADHPLLVLLRRPLLLQLDHELEGDVYILLRAGQLRDGVSLNIMLVVGQSLSLRRFRLMLAF